MVGIALAMLLACLLLGAWSLWGSAPTLVGPVL